MNNGMNVWWSLFLVSFQASQPQTEKTKQDCVEEQKVNRIIFLK